jgi:hypothetical protein
MINWDKPLRTVATHRSCRVICKDRVSLEGLTHVILASVMNGSDQVWVVNSEGEDSRTRFKIENIPEKHEGWMNIYPNEPTSTVGYVYNSLEKARSFSGGGGVQVKVTWEE